jgi:putative oxidoreductase
MSSNGYVKFTWFLLRIVSGFTFFQSGAVKLFGWYGGMPAGQPPLQILSQVGIGAILEVVGGIAIVLGLATRPVAFLLSGEMAVAYWQFHAPGGTWPVENGGGPAVLYCFIFLFMSAYGAGDWSIDARLKRRHAATE